MNSLKRKLFIQIGILVITLVGIMILANTLVYKPYYHKMLQSNLAEYYSQIDEVSHDSYDQRLKSYIKVESSSNVDILILNGDEIVYTSNGYMLEERARKRDQYLRGEETEPFNPQLIKSEPPTFDHKANRPPIKIEKIEALNVDASYYLASGDPFFDNKLLILAGTLSSGELFELKIPMVSIQNNIDISNKFMLTCGIVLFIIAMLYAYRLSTTFTKPILEMSKVTKEMTALTFDNFCQVDSQNELGQLAASINDLSRSLSDSISKLNRKNDQLEELVNNVSHELKTPLALVQGYAEGIELNIARDEKKTKFYAEVIIDEAKKMNRIVEMLLNIRSYENGEKEKFSKTFDLGILIERVIEKFEPLLKKDELKITFNQVKNVSAIGDAFDVEQVLTNYVSNAVNYVDLNKEIEILLRREDDILRIYVYNSCQLFDEDELETVWNKFTKRDVARYRENGGHGLGLSIVKAIQESNDLNCGVENMKNGVAFWFDVLSE